MEPVTEFMKGENDFTLYHFIFPFEGIILVNICFVRQQHQWIFQRSMGILLVHSPSHAKGWYLRSDIMQLL